jgi:hypothetical protein
VSGPARAPLVAAGCDGFQRRYAAAFVTLDPRIGESGTARIVEQFDETLARLQKTTVPRIDHPVVPLQAILQRLAADVAGADEGRAFDQSAVNRARKQIGLEVKAGRTRRVHTHIGALRLQDLQETQGLRIGHSQVIAGHEPHATGAARVRLGHHG